MSPALVVPTLAAGPFLLRPFSLADIDAVAEASTDPHIPLITTVPAAFTEDEGRRFIERQWSRAEQGIGYSFAIADAGTDRAVGQIGLWMKDAGEGRASVGYWVIRSARGRGAAARALQTLVTWAHRDLQVPRLELQVEPWNSASVKTAEKAGFQREGLLRGWQEVGGTRKDMYMYARLDADPMPYSVSDSPAVLEAAPCSRFQRSKSFMPPEMAVRMTRCRVNAPMTNTNAASPNVITVRS
jgi:RimJ/RimL family protein N-acetyltransferase